MSDPIPFPDVTIEFNFVGSTKWLLGTFSVQELHKMLTDGTIEEMVVDEIKMQSWIAEDDEFRNSYVAYSPKTKLWRIGYDS